MKTAKTKGWCERCQLDPTHAVVLSGVFDVPDEVLREVIGSVKIFGKA